jgi:LacI family transcriptional regulator, galactose operon repressor
MTVTIRDVARRLNLSITTVSRALDGYEDVAEETRQLVIRTAHEMGYVPNQAARQLRRRRSDTIGYILPADTPHFSNPFFTEQIAGFGDEASLHGFDLLVSTAPPGSPAEQRAYEGWTHSRKVDGMLLNRIRLHDWRVQYLSQACFPFVTFGRSEDELNYPSVEVNWCQWFRALIDHLASLGHQRIAYVGASPDLKIQADRYRGYQDGLQDHGLTFDPGLVVEGNLTTEGGYRAASQLLSMADPPTAIACVDDMTAIGVLHAARERGRLVGQDLAVAGFDGIEGFEHTQPPLTTVNQPIYQIARTKIQMLIAQIRGEGLLENNAILEPRLEIRLSTIGNYPRTVNE